VLQLPSTKIPTFSKPPKTMFTFNPNIHLAIGYWLLAIVTFSSPSLSPRNLGFDFFFFFYAKLINGDYRRLASSDYHSLGFDFIDSLGIWVLISVSFL